LRTIKVGETKTKDNKLIFLPREKTVTVTFFLTKIYKMSKMNRLTN